MENWEDTVILKNFDTKFLDEEHSEITGVEYDTGIGGTIDPNILPYFVFVMSIYHFSKMTDSIEKIDYDRWIDRST